MENFEDEMSKPLVMPEVPVKEGKEKKEKPKKDNASKKK